MKALRAYDIVAPLGVYQLLRTLGRSPRREIELFLYRLALQPGLPGDFETPAEDGRTHQVKMVGRWLVSYWIDHAVREVRVTGIEPVE